MVCLIDKIQVRSGRRGGIVKIRLFFFFSKKIIRNKMGKWNETALTYAAPLLNTSRTSVHNLNSRDGRVRVT